MSEGTCNSEVGLPSRLDMEVTPTVGSASDTAHDATGVRAPAGAPEWRLHRESQKAVPDGFVLSSELELL